MAKKGLTALTRKGDFIKMLTSQQKYFQIFASYRGLLEAIKVQNGAGF